MSKRYPGLKLRTGTRADFSKVPIGVCFKLLDSDKDKDFLYVRTVRRNGSNAEEYDGDHGISVSSWVRVMQYPKAGERGEKLIISEVGRSYKINPFTGKPEFQDGVIDLPAEA